MSPDDKEIRSFSLEKNSRLAFGSSLGLTGGAGAFGFWPPSKMVVDIASINMRSAISCFHIVFLMYRYCILYNYKIYTT